MKIHYQYYISLKIFFFINITVFEKIDFNSAQSIIYCPLSKLMRNTDEPDRGKKLIEIHLGFLNINIYKKKVLCLAYPNSYRML